jgi:galactokinase
MPKQNKRGLKLVMHLNEAKKVFLDLYGGNESDLRFFAAPGRVNLIGEHTDYNGGYVFPAALTMRTLIIARKNGKNTITLAATDLPDRVSLDIDNLANYKNIGWGSYQAAIAYTMKKEGFEITGCDMLFDDTTPHGAGLSSSAAIEVAAAFALATFSNEKKGIKNDVDLIQIAKIGQKAENEYIGVNCGIMDKFSSAMGRKNHAIFLDCKDLSYKLVPLAIDGYKIVISNTNKKRSLQTSKYNERRSECDIALRSLQKSLPEKNYLGEITIDEFEKYKHSIEDAAAKKRARHVVYECDRVLKSIQALLNNDIKTFGHLMVESHNSLRDLYEVTGIELDTLVEEALKIDGVIGTRMTGAGFGGCTVSIVREEAIDKFINDVGKNYESKIGYPASFYISEIGDGAREVK